MQWPHGPSTSTPLQQAVAIGEADLIRYLARAHVDFQAGGCGLFDVGPERIGDSQQAGMVGAAVRADPDLLQLLRSRAGQPRPLLQLALDAVRASLKHSGIPLCSAHTLPLPASLHAALLYDV